MPDVPWLSTAAAQFAPEGTVTDIRVHGSGNVNDTFLVTAGSGREVRFILQRLNRHVFHQPERLMANMRVVTSHMAARLGDLPALSGRRWEVPRVLRAQDGSDHWIDPADSFWRALSCIEGAESRDSVRSPGQAQEIGFAIGTFHRLVSDLSAERLFDTLRGFHITPLYLRRYDEVLAEGRAGLSHEEGFCARFVNDRRAAAGILEEAKQQGRLRLRPIHGDPKVNNVMVAPETGQAVGMIDLDTVKPGLIHYDIGDCLRSCCNPLGEETERWEDVRFETDLCRGVLQGYHPEAKTFLTAADCEYLYDALCLIAFELGLRFFTDHLEGNVYFKARREGHNLARALAQFRLTESIESQEEDIRRIIQDLR